MTPPASRLTETQAEALDRHITAIEERMIDPRDFGRLEQEVRQLSTQVTDMKKTLETINDTLSQARGGWRTLMLLGGAGAAVGSAVSWVIQHVRIGT